MAESAGLTSWPGSVWRLVPVSPCEVCAGNTDVVIADDDVKGNAADEGSTGFIGVNVAVPDGKPEVAIAAFRAIVISVVAGVDREVRLGESGRAGNLEILHVVHQVDNASLEVGEARRV